MAVEPNRRELIKGAGVLAMTAVLVVDMQNNFVARGGMFDLAGSDLSVIQQAVAPCV